MGKPLSGDILRIIMDRTIKPAVPFLAVLLTILFTAVPVRPWADNTGWTREKQHGTVTIFSRVPTGSRVKEFKAVTDLTAPIERVWRILQDVSRYPDWFGDCMEAEEVARPTENRIQYFLLMKTTGPLKNREIYAEALYSGSANDEKREVIMRDAPGLPRKTHKTSKPVKTLSGHCELIVSDPGVTRVEYSILIDPGEEIPTGLSNLFVLGQVEKIMAGLKKMSEK